MGMELQSARLWLGGMSCTACQERIEKALLRVPGVQRARVRYAKSIAEVSYDPAVASIEAIKAAVEQLGYQVLEKPPQGVARWSRPAGFLLLIAALFAVLQHVGLLHFLVPSQLANTNMHYPMLFLLGLMTSVHCVAMCGGIGLSCQTAALQKSGVRALRPVLLYHLGRVASYTSIGGIVGLLGTAVTFSTGLQGLLKLAAGLCMAIMGVSMLGLFPWLRRFVPHMPKAFAKPLDSAKVRGKSPLIVGILNGLMPCGSLQAMQVYALSTGSPIKGAFSMLLFSLGTVPLLFGLGALSSVLSQKFAAKMRAAGAVLVAVLGLAMVSQGWSLAGWQLPRLAPQSTSQPGQSGGVERMDGVQVVRSELAARGYPNITVRAGIPVRWILQAPEGSLNGCNNRMLLPRYDIEYTLQPGENVILFTPEAPGTVRYSCWMGMLQGTITVIA